MRHTDMPSMDAGAMPNPTIRRVKTSMTSITQWLRMRIDSTRNRSTHQTLSLARAMRVSQDGPSAPGLGSKVYGKHATHDIFEACGWEQIPVYLIRARDRAYGEIFVRRVRSIGIRDRPTSFCSPFAERLIG